MGYVRRNFLVPIPSFESFDALNAHLEQHCVRRFDDRLRGILKKCVNGQAVYPLSEQDGLKAQERRYTAYGKEKH